MTKKRNIAWFIICMAVCTYVAISVSSTYRADSYEMALSTYLSTQKIYFNQNAYFFCLVYINYENMMSTSVLVRCCRRIHLLNIMYEKGARLFPWYMAIVIIPIAMIALGSAAANATITIFYIAITGLLFIVWYQEYCVLLLITENHYISLGIVTISHIVLLIILMFAGDGEILQQYIYDLRLYPAVIAAMAIVSGIILKKKEWLR